ncbi:hypothetical protein K8R47_00315, partial [archaeon]|nr:hypothetical protein [archaeon]
NGEVTSLLNKINEISKNIDEHKSKSEEFHKKLLQVSKDKNYDEFITESKKINELKTKQEEAFKKFLDLKNQFTGLNDQLKDKLKESGEIRKKEEKEIKFVKEKKKKKEEKDLESKTKEVEEKLKTKKKLTTEDLIVLQGKK